MSGKGGGSHNNGGGKALSATIPASSRKMVQSLKEIVSNFPDHEIYATLKDCNMDPNEAVSRLLSQDPFHEVKSKREKKKEIKDPIDSRSRGSGTSNTSSRGGGRAGTDRHGGRGSANQFGSSDSGLQGKPAYKKENGAPSYGGSTSSASSVLGNNANRRPVSYSDSVATEKTYALGISDGPSSSSQRPGLQSAWMGNAGQVSMADIVKMGRPQARPSVHHSSIQSGNHQNILLPPAVSDDNLHSLQGYASKVSETNTNQGHALSENVPQNDDWSCIENQHDVRGYEDVDAHASSEYYANSSNFAETDWQQKNPLDEYEAEDGSVENADNDEYASISAKSTSEDNTGAEDDVSSVAANIEQLNIQRDDQGTEQEDENPSVVIPNHLQLHTPECMNLSFGSFGSGNPLSGPGSFTSRPLNTISHYDIPQELQERYEGWLSPNIAEDFKYYADICFKNFGDRVKYWITFNEPNVASICGYRKGIWPPGRCSGSFGNCTNGGDSEREPFIAGSNLLLSHATAVHLYRTKYQKIQGGKIGLVMHTMWFEPISNSSEDKIAAERAQSFFMNWFLDPVIRGEYPREMREILGEDLPPVPYKLEKQKPAIDFIGVNHYTSYFVKDCIHSVCEPGLGSTRTEGFALKLAKMNGMSIGEPTSLHWLYVYPQGMEKIVTYIKERYNNIPMFITENGVGMRENSNLTTKEMINDVERVEYLRAYLDSLATAIRKGADVRGYFLWSLLDNFEWTEGSSIRFGLHRVDYDTLQRTPRMSASWYKNFIALHVSGPGMKPPHTQE